MFEIVSKPTFDGHVFQARLSGVPLGSWHPKKTRAVRDILNTGVRGEVVDKTDAAPFVDQRSLGWS